MILIGSHWTEMEKFFIFTPASSHRALRVSQSAPASVILQCRYARDRAVPSRRFVSAGGSAHPVENTPPPVS